MLLLFRFLLLMTRGLFRRRIGPLDSSTVRFTALPHDCDLNLHLNAGRFISFMDVARIEMLVRMRLLHTILRRGWRPVMGGCSVRFRRSVLPFERFEVRSRLLGWDEKWMYIEHLVERQGEFCAAGLARVLFRSANGTVSPTEFLSLLGLPLTESPELPAFVQKWTESEDLR